MTKAYFAHQVSDYNTTRESDAIAVIHTMGWDVTNPNMPHHQEGYVARGMEYFTEMLPQHDVLVFMKNKWGEVGSGVAMEMFAAHNLGIPLFEADPRMETLVRVYEFEGYKFLTREETKARNKEARE